MERQPSNVVEKLTKVFTKAIKSKVSVGAHHHLARKTSEDMRIECLNGYLEKHLDTLIGYESETGGGIDKSVTEIMNTYYSLETQWLYYRHRQQARTWKATNILQVR